MDKNLNVMPRIRTYPSSPRRFDPHTASQEELLRYGFPRRPDPEKEPQLARHWKRVFARPVRFIQAKLEVDRVMRARDPLSGAATESGIDRWAGIVKLMSQAKGSDFTQPATMVFGQWQLPNVLPVTPNERIAVAFWVGLDGAPSLGEPASKQVLQAGVAAQVNPGGFFQSTRVKWWAWTEWYTELHKDSAVAVKNFPVAMGDEIFVVILTGPSDHALVSMLNITRGIGVSVGLNAPSDIVALGQSAEWIVEYPSGSPHIPMFTPVTFTDCTAGSLVQNDIFNLAGGFPTEIRTPGSSASPFGTPLTKTSIASPTVAVVEEIEIDWF
jgi:hypothetical protein